MSIQYIESKTNFSSIIVEFLGSVSIETTKMRGLSHLMEHLLCKNLDKYLSLYTKYGIEWNAYTTNTKIIFYISGLEKYVNLIARDFIEFYTTFNITKEQFENEKKIVYQEYLDSKPTDSDVILDSNLSKIRYNCYDPIGIGKEILEFTYEQGLQYYEKYLKIPSNIYFVNKTNSIYDFNFLYDIETNNNEYLKYIIPFKINSNRSEIEEIGYSEIVYLKPDRDLSESLCYQSNLINHEDYQYIDFILKMYNFGLESPLYKIIREQYAYAYRVYSYLREYNNNKAFTIHLGCSTDSKNLENVNNIYLDIVLDNTHLNEENFNRIKENLDINEEKKQIYIHDYHSEITSLPMYRYSYIKDKVNLNKLLEIHKKYFFKDNFMVCKTTDFVLNEEIQK